MAAEDNKLDDDPDWKFRWWIEGVLLSGVSCLGVAGNGVM